MSTRRLLALGWGLWWWLVAGAAAGSLCGEMAQDDCVVVEGTAALKGATARDQAYARQLAVRQALAAAAQRCHAEVQGYEAARNFQLTHSEVSVRSGAAVRGFTILREDPDVEGGVYHVRIRACLQPISRQCPTPLAAAYQPRLAVAAVLVAQPQQARDIRRLRAGWQEGLTAALRQQGWHNVVLWPGQVVMQPGAAIAPDLDPDRLAEIREETGAQYLLLTVIHELGMADAAPQDTMGQLWGSVRRYYDLDAEPRYRALQVGWYVIDLMEGRIVEEGRLQRSVAGPVRIGRDRPFGGEAFRQTVTGRALLQMVRQQAQRVAAALQCAPWGGEVLEVQRPREEGASPRIVFFAHRESGLRPGDVVTIYRQADRPVRRAGRVLGTLRQPIGFARVVEVASRFAVAEVFGSREPVREGDQVRGW